MKKFFQCEKGVAAVEFALVAPILLLIIMAVVDYGTFINQKMQLQDLARTSAQYVVQGGADADVDTNIYQTSDFYTNVTSQGQVITSVRQQKCECADGVVITCGDVCVGAGDYVRYYYTVRLTSTYTPIFAYPGLPDSVALEGFSRMQYNP